MCFGGGKKMLKCFIKEKCILYLRKKVCTLFLNLLLLKIHKGLQVALGADMRFSTPDCRLSIMESRWGLIPDMGASITLRELVRIDVAKELTMTGRIVSGLEAEKIGLVTRCVEDPLKEAMDVAKEIVER